MRTALCLVLLSLLSTASAYYFVTTSPSRNDQWVNGETHAVSWVKGANDGVTSFDIELSRMSSTGLTLIAKNVPSVSSSPAALNIQLTDIPPGDDYFLLFLNSTHGLVYGTSQRFAILPAGASGGNMSTTLNAKAATVTASGAPSPTQSWAMTFALASAARREMRPILGVSLLGCVLGAVWTLV